MKQIFLALMTLTLPLNLALADNHAEPTEPYYEGQGGVLTMPPIPGPEPIEPFREGETIYMPHVPGDKL